MLCTHSYRSLLFFERTKKLTGLQHQLEDGIRVLPWPSLPEAASSIFFSYVMLCKQVNDVILS